MWTLTRRACQPHAPRYSPTTEDSPNTTALPQHPIPWSSRGAATGTGPRQALAHGALTAPTADASIHREVDPSSFPLFILTLLCAVLCACISSRPRLYSSVDSRISILSKTLLFQDEGRGETTPVERTEDLLLGQWLVPGSSATLTDTARCLPGPWPRLMMLTSRAPSLLRSSTFTWARLAPSSVTRPGSCSSAPAPLPPDGPVLTATPQLPPGARPRPRRPARPQRGRHR